MEKQTKTENSGSQELNEFLSSLNLQNVDARNISRTRTTEDRRKAELLLQKAYEQISKDANIGVRFSPFKTKKGKVDVGYTTWYVNNVIKDNEKYKDLKVRSNTDSCIIVKLL